MEFDPNNHVVKICIQGMNMEDKGNAEEAGKLFLQAWNDATNDLERFLAAHFVARHQKNASDRLNWLQSALQFALKVNDDSVKGSFSSLYSNIANCYETLGDSDNARKYHELSVSCKGKISDEGPFYHGTKVDLIVGNLLTPGFASNYNQELLMNHIYFTGSLKIAGLAASLAKGEGRERVYLVEPTGSFENDPNVTDKKFPGNPTRSYRTDAPLKIVGEVTDWTRQTSQQNQEWREKLANVKGDIIN